MSDVPSFLRPEVAAAFGDRNVAASYRHRPAYPVDVFDTLVGLIADEPRTVLDLGCGTGFVARPLAQRVDRVDAVDVSAAMVEEGKSHPGGDHPRLRWIVGQAESVALDPPYALVTAGDSLHWMDWDVVLPRLAEMLTPNGLLAILSVGGQVVTDASDFQQGLVKLIQRYSTFSEWRPDFDLVTELNRRGLFREDGRVTTEVVPFQQSIDDYVESFHARASLSWERMTPENATAFDAGLRQFLIDRVGDRVELAVRASIVWGRPRRGGGEDSR